MATPVFIQSKSAAGPYPTSSLSITFDAPNTAGNTIVVAFQYGGGVNNSIAVSDSQGNDYTGNFVSGLGNYPGGHPPGSASQLWWANDIKAGANTVTLDLSGTLFGVDNITACILEYNPNATALLLDNNAVNNNYPAGADADLTCTIPDGFLTHSPDLVIGVGGSGNQGGTFTAGAGYTVRDQVSDPGGLQSMFVEDKIVSSTAGLTATATMSAPGPWLMTLAAFYQAAPSLSVTPDSLAYQNHWMQFPNFTGEVRQDQAKILTITSSGDWSITSDPWLKCVPSSGSGNGSISVSLYKVEQNLVETDNGVIRTKSGMFSGSVVVTPSSGDPVTVPVTYQVGYSDQIQEFV
jgi:hypothetical protein